MKFIQLQEYFGKERDIRDIITNTSWLHCVICHRAHEPGGEPIPEELYPVLVNIGYKVFGLCKKHFLEAWDSIHEVVEKEEKRTAGQLLALKEKNEKMDQLIESVKNYYALVDEHDKKQDELIEIFRKISRELNPMDIMHALDRFKRVRLEGEQR
jgi:hypothetical protein